MQIIKGTGSDAGLSGSGRGRMAVDRVPWGLIVLLTLAAGLRSLYLIYPIMDADQAINGLMARHILLGEFPIFFYGQEYCGSLENYLVAVVFLLFGASRFTLGLAIGLVSLFLVFFVFQLASSILGRRRAWVAALLAAVPSGYFAFTSVLARSAYIETPLLGCLLFIVVGRLLRGERRPVFYLLTGLVSGLGLWTHFLSVFFLAPAGLLLLIRERGFIRAPGGAALLLAGALLGGLPFWIYNTVHPLATWHFLQGNPVHEPFQVSLRSFFLIRLPELLGVRDIAGGGFYIPLISIGLYVLFLAGLLYLFFLRGKHLRRALPGIRVFTPELNLLLLMLLFYPLIFSLSGFGAANTTRYLVPLYPLIPLLVSFLFFQIRKAAGIPAWIFLGIILASNAYGTYRVAVAFQPAQAREYRRKEMLEQAVIGFLKERAIRTVYVPDYWRAVPFTFVAREEIIFAQPQLDRYPPYTQIVDRSGRPAYLLSGDASAFEATLAALGGTYQKKRIGELWIFFDWVPPPWNFVPLSDRSWRAFSNRGEEPITAVIDRDLTTGWSSGRSMKPGDVFMLDLGRVWNDLGRITLLAGSRAGLPRGLRLEISDDGRNWKPALAIPTLWDSLVWSGPHPFVRPGKGALELVFTPQSGRYLKIIQTGSDERNAWEIVEVLVYRALPADRGGAAANTPQSGDLPKRLPFLGIERVWAGPWLQAYLPARYRIDLDPNSGAVLPPQSDRLSDPVIPAYLVWKEQAAGLREILQQRHPGIYRELPFADLVLFQAAGSSERYRPLSSSGWRAEASANSREAWKAIDGRMATRWTSGSPQVPGLWYRLDLGRPLTINRIRLRLGESLRDFPRDLETYFSVNGRDWLKAEPLNSPVYWDGEHLFRERPAGETDLVFPDTSVRYIEFRQQGRDPTYYWSIYEIELYQPGDGAR